MHTIKNDVIIFHFVRSNNQADDVSTKGLGEKQCCILLLASWALMILDIYMHQYNIQHLLK